MLILTILNSILLAHGFTWNWNLVAWMGWQAKNLSAMIVLRTFWNSRHPTVQALSQAFWRSDLWNHLLRDLISDPVLMPPLWLNTSLEWQIIWHMILRSTGKPSRYWQMVTDHLYNSGLRCFPSHLDYLPLPHWSKIERTCSKWDRGQRTEEIGGSFQSFYQKDHSTFCCFLRCCWCFSSRVILDKVGRDRPPKRKESADLADGEVWLPFWMKG